MRRSSLSWKVFVPDNIWKALWLPLPVAHASICGCSDLINICCVNVPSYWRLRMLWYVALKSRPLYHKEFTVTSEFQTSSNRIWTQQKTSVRWGLYRIKHLLCNFSDPVGGRSRERTLPFENMNCSWLSRPWRSRSLSFALFSFPPPSRSRQML